VSTFLQRRKGLVERSEPRVSTGTPQHPEDYNKPDHGLPEGSLQACIATVPGDYFVDARCFSSTTRATRLIRSWSRCGFTAASVSALSSGTFKA
jgi:hypothetical protein